MLHTQLLNIWYFISNQCKNQEKHLKQTGNLVGMYFLKQWVIKHPAGEGDTFYKVIKLEPLF